MKALNDFDINIKPNWVFYENYDNLGACMYDGIIIIPILKTTIEVIQQCPKAYQWYLDFMNSPF